MNDSDTVIGEKVLKTDDINTVLKSQMVEYFNRFKKEQNYRHWPWSSQRFGVKFKKLNSKLETVRSYGRPREFGFPLLKECQRYFT